MDDSAERAGARIDPESGTFCPLSWSEVVAIVRARDLHLLTRDPASLARYHAWKEATVQTYGSVERYILEERLHWTASATPASPTAFQVRSDWKCLLNDFPYAFEPGITHLVVWTKNKLPVDGEGHLSAEGRPLLEHFLDRFLDGERDRDWTYFLNPPGLKSIGNLEHFHVLVRNQDATKYYQ